MSERLQQTIEVVERLETVLHEGRALLKDLRKENKEAQRTVNYLQVALKSLVDAEVSGVIDASVAEHMEAFSEEIKEAQKKSTDQIFKTFDSLFNQLMYGNSQGRGESLAEKVDRLRREIE